MTHYYFTIPDPDTARGSDAELAFHSLSPDGMAQELQNALASDSLFLRWKAKQDEPDAINSQMAQTDPSATVLGAQRDLKITLEVVTDLPSELLRHRLTLLAGHHWQLRDVTS